MKAQINGKTYYLESGDSYLPDGIAEIPSTEKLFKSLIGNKGEAKARTALDVGANVGIHSLILSDMAEKVVAFELVPLTFKYLDCNISDAEVNNVELRNFGLGREKSKRVVQYAAHNRSGAFISTLRASAGHESEQVEVRTLDSLHLSDIDFIKIDVEGFEYQVLEGGANTLLQSQPNCVLELNHWCLNAFQDTSVPSFFRQLRGIFPILLAVNGDTYRDLRDSDSCYIVMYEQIINRSYPTIVAAFYESQVSTFREIYKKQ